MTSTYAMDWIQQMLWTAVLTAGPVILAVVIIGLMMAIVQAATQVNDGAVAFAPKALVAVTAVVVSGPWMMSQMAEFMTAALTTMGTMQHGG